MQCRSICGWLLLSLALSACGGSGSNSGGASTGDTVSPTVPGGLAAVPSSSSTVSLSWQASSDNTAVTGYRIYRDGSELKTAASTASSDTGLTSGVSYCYEISAFDAANNESARSTMECATPGNVWTQRTPGADMVVEAIIHDGTRYVAVGDPISTNYVLTSSDGLSWMRHQTALNILNFEDIVWTGSQYIAISDRGTFYTSPDAIDFTTQHFMTSLIDINALAWSGSIAVAVGEDGNIWTSADGITWTQQSGVTTEYLTDVEWLNNVFVAVGGNGTVLFSTDGVNWTVEATGGTETLATVAWNGNTYVVLGTGVGYTSTTGVTWAPVVITGLLEDVVWADALNLFVAVDANGTIMTSPDGMSWTERVDFNQFDSLDTVFWDGAMLIAGGDIGEIVTSSDGSNWTTRASAIDIERVRFDGTRLYAVGGPSKLITSMDGINWSFHRTGYRGDFLRDIASSSSRITAAAQTYYMSTTVDLSAPWPVHEFFGATTVDEGVIWDGTRFVSVGSDGRMRISADGITRTDIGSTTTGTTALLREIVHSGSLYVVVGNDGTIITSPDLSTWTAQSSGTSNHLYAIAHFGNQYVAVGQNGTVLTSNDAINWMAGNSGTTNLLYGITWAGDEFVAVGAGTTILRSVDGVTWSDIATSIPFNTYKSVAYTGSRVVVAGNNGVVVTLEKP